MLNWKYDENNVDEPNFELIPVGNHRVRVESAEEQVSKAGNEMIKFVFTVSGHKGKLFYYLVANANYPGITNANIKSIAESFGIDPKEVEPKNLIGKVGAVRVKHDAYGAKVSYFLSKEKSEDLPEWKEDEEIPF